VDEAGGIVEVAKVAQSRAEIKKKPARSGHRKNLAVVVREYLTPGLSNWKKSRCL